MLKTFKQLLIATLVGATVAAAPVAEAKRPRGGDDKPIVIGHRGASGYLPEHTLAAYAVALEMGADYIEPDLVMTKDGVLVARHENEIGGTTDVSTRTEFASRKTTKLIDGVSVTGWFTEDFTLAELKTLRAKERIPAVRPQNTRFDGAFEIPTLAEVLELAKAYDRMRDEGWDERGWRRAKRVGVYPETKHPTYFQALGLPMEDTLVRTLAKHGYFGREAPVFIQSFEVGNLKKLSRMTRIRLVQLLDASGAPWDFRVAGDPRTYADLAKPAGLAEIASYAQGVGLNKNLIFPRAANGSLLPKTTVVDDAQARGLLVHGWTFRAENQFLPLDFRTGTDPIGLGNLAAEMKLFLEAGLDGYFTDNPDVGVRARDAFVAK